MGTLDFEEVEVEVLSPDAALVWGAYRLQRAADQPNGRFTLVFRRVPSGDAGGADAWRIVHDHTSAAD